MHIWETTNQICSKPGTQPAYIAYMPRWHEEETKDPRDFFHTRNPQPTEPDSPIPPLERAEAEMKGILYIVLNAIMHMYDNLCSSPSDRLLNDRLKLFNNLDFEAGLESRLVPNSKGETEYKFVLNPETIQRILRLSYKYPTHYRLFRCLAHIFLDTPHWLLIRQILGAPDIGFNYVPIHPHKYLRITEEYAGYFIQGYAVYEGKRGVLAYLAGAAAAIQAGYMYRLQEGRDSQLKANEARSGPSASKNGATVGSGNNGDPCGEATDEDSFLYALEQIDNMMGEELVGLCRGSIYS